MHIIHTDKNGAMRVQSAWRSRIGAIGLKRPFLFAMASEKTTSAGDKEQ